MRGDVGGLKTEGPKPGHDEIPLFLSPHICLMSTSETETIIQFCFGGFLLLFFFFLIHFLLQVSPYIATFLIVGQYSLSSMRRIIPLLFLPKHLKNTTREQSVNKLQDPAALSSHA